MMKSKKGNNYPDYIDPRFDVNNTNNCEGCEHNFYNSGVVINFNPICAHCSRVIFSKSDMYVRCTDDDGK